MAQENPPIEEKDKTATYDLLKDDVDEKDLEKVEPKGEKEVIDLEDDVNEEKEEKVEEKEEEKEVDDAEVQINIPRNKEILAKYPNLFKEFPHLKTASIKLQKFYEVFPSITDAEETVKDLENFKEFEKEINAGNLEGTLKQVRESDKDAFGRIVDNYLPNLQKADESAYFHVISGVIKSTIVSMVEDAKNGDNEELKAAASLLHQYVFGKTQWQPHTRFGPDNKKDEKQEKFEQEKNSYIEQRFNDAKTDLGSRVENIIESTIVDNIDPKGQMTDYVRKTAIRQVKEALDDIIEKDETFKKVLNSSWQRAGSENFSRASLDKIKGAWLSKARVHLKDLIAKARKDALEGLGKRVREEKVQETKREKTAPSNRREDDSDEPKKKSMRTIDYFMQD